MKPQRVLSVRAREILDSRGRPTLEATCELTGSGLANTISARASTPSGASTGSAEALELRDGDPSRYGGLGCRKAVENVNGEICRAVSGRVFESQAEWDDTLCRLDGTPNKSRLGANAVLSASLAFARACAVAEGLPLYSHFAALANVSITRLPRPIINLYSGGKHAGNQSPMQDLLIVPARPTTMDEALAMTYAVYQAAAQRMQKKYGVRILRADEGGLAPPFPNPESMFSDAMEAIHAAGLEPGRDVSLGVDVASSHFYADGRYHLGEEALAESEMIQRLAVWQARYPIVSIEDGLQEEAWDGWPALCATLGSRCRIVGDDFLCTHPGRIQRAIELRAANTLLLKVNQIGTLTEALRSLERARSAGWQVMVSARSGETEDDWLADLAVGWNGDQIKIGSITQSERLAKYNRLLAIEAATGGTMNMWPLSVSG